MVEQKQSPHTLSLVTVDSTESSGLLVALGDFCGFAELVSQVQSLCKKAGGVGGIILLEGCWEHSHNGAAEKESQKKDLSSGVCAEARFVGNVGNGYFDAVKMSTSWLRGFGKDICKGQG